MRFADLDAAALARRLAGDGIGLDFGLARARIRSDVDALAPALRQVYQHCDLLPADGLFDMTVDLARRPGVRGYLRPQIEFRVEGNLPFEAFPAQTTLPLLEWGLNWCVANRRNQYLLLHCAAVELQGVALLMPGVPGAGKSTLAAALMSRGFRLLSDEFGAVRLDDGTMQGSVRPIALKNNSIDVIRQFAPGIGIGPTFLKTRKGDLAHVAPDRNSFERSHEPARPVLIVFPKYEAGADIAWEDVPQARTFIQVAGNSFNYELLGLDGFRAVNRLTRQCPAVALRYSRLDEAVAALREQITGLERAGRA